jgi:hypothetical protein
MLLYKTVDNLIINAIQGFAKLSLSYPA